MRSRWWLVQLVIVALWFPKTLVAGQESKGAEGVRIKIWGELELGGTVHLWDKITHQHEFMPKEHPAYEKVIKPQLNILKGKLPRLAHRIEAFFRGINPTWYLVEADLKEELTSPQTDLILCFERVQVALHNGQEVRINERLLKKMPEVEQGWTLMHEVLRSAVEVSALQDDSIIAMLNAVIMHKDLDKFEKKELAKRLLFLLRGGEIVPGFFSADTEAEKKLFDITKRIHAKLGPVTPLIALIEADLKVAAQEVGEWEDHSTFPDGMSGTNCLYETDQCVFRDRKRGPLYWSMISPGSVNEDNVKTFHDAAKACPDLKTWGGFSDWRLPTFSELYDLNGRINRVVKEVFNFGRNNNVFLWAMTSPADSSWWMLEEQDPKRAWGINLASQQEREFDKQSLNSLRCMRDDLNYYWVDQSTTEQGASAPCSQDGVECSVRSRRSKLTWSAPSPKYQPIYAENRRGDDLGYVSISRAHKLCRNLTWAGHQGWRLPTPAEVREAHRDGLYAWSMKHEKFGLLLGSVWAVEQDFDPGDVAQGFSFDEGKAKESWDRLDPYRGLRRYVCVHEPHKAVVGGVK